ncbi:hypothetical protein HDA40_005831 [Hamadaea flava]|uniref:Protein phosphatase 2C domain-containing protein n=1 Tax=Hamadaea flava TaxID=1742688 RepID=A0ABV8LSC8_9ACTN|nr:protein phosphatase 2C domain-containing protein [Hamadaea flava]MCP2327324.1 hypothetical protein [Hamadaea flava]
MIEVRSATAAAPGRPENEDAVFQVGNLVGVLDGVTQADGVDSGCIHGAAWYVRRLARRLAEQHSADPAKPLKEILAEAISAVRDDHPDCDLTAPTTPAATVCLVRVDAGRFDYLVLCDVTLVLEVEGEVQAITDDRFEQIITRLRRAPADSDDAFAANRGYTPGKWDFTNRDGGYWIAAAEPAAAAHAITGSLPAHGDGSPSRIALLTDGAACAVDSLGILTWPALLKVLSDEGPSELIRQVREAERRRNAAGRVVGKPHDDATAAVLVITEEP